MVAFILAFGNRTAFAVITKKTRLVRKLKMELTLGEIFDHVEHAHFHVVVSIVCSVLALACLGAAAALAALTYPEVRLPRRTADRAQIALLCVVLALLLVVFVEMPRSVSVTFLATGPLLMLLGVVVCFVVGAITRAARARTKPTCPTGIIPIAVAITGTVVIVVVLGFNLAQYRRNGQAHPVSAFLHELLERVRLGMSYTTFRDDVFDQRPLSTFTKDYNKLSKDALDRMESRLRNAAGRN
jgi:amino acid transporter